LRLANVRGVQALWDAEPNSRKLEGNLSDEISENFKHLTLARDCKFVPHTPERDT
jgi:hypothetical protein